MSIRPEIVGAAIDTLIAALTLPDVADAMQGIISLCEQACPHPDWHRLRTLDYAAEIPVLRAWFDQTLATTPPATPIRGLYFLLAYPAFDDGQYTLDMCLVGTKEYDPEDKEMEWLFSRHYMPEAYAVSEVLRELHAISYPAQPGGASAADSLGNDAEWALGLAFAVLAARAVLEGRTTADLPTDAARIGVAAGWGGGDLLPVGELTEHGFVPAVPQS